MARRERCRDDRDTGRCDEEEQAGADAEERAAEEVVRRAREQGLSLTGPDGLLKQLTKTVLETALNQERTEHLGHGKRGQPVAGNVRNGTRPKAVLTEGSAWRCGCDAVRWRWWC
jgi:putative transposase